MSDVKHKLWCKKIYGWLSKAKYKNKSNESKSSPEQNKKTKYEYQKLTPYTKVDLKENEKAFEYVFQHDDVRNIAISGAYGSGKSSLIESYKKLSSNYKYE